MIAACTVVFTAAQVHPVFLGQTPLAGRVLAGAYLDSATIRAPWLSLPEPLAMRHPQFQKDVDAFAADLRRTGRIAGERVDSIARVAVREAYHRRVPPALVLGVMLTENDRFKSRARSNVGALGLMQVMPRLWTHNLGPLLGSDLRDDETNVRYGVYILRLFARRTPDTLDASDLTRVALLGYNGCVTGSNTKDCRAYPSKVQRHVELSALSTCSGRPFKECVALPLWAAIRDTTTPPMPSMMVGNALRAAATDRSHDAPRTAGLSSRLSHWLSSARIAD